MSPRSAPCGTLQAKCKLDGATIVLQFPDVISLCLMTCITMSCQRPCFCLQSAAHNPLSAEQPAFHCPAHMPPHGVLSHDVTVLELPYIP